METLKLKMTFQENLSFLLNLIKHEKCNLQNIEWQSKYNAYVVYDYEPFSKDGFDIYVTLQGESQRLNFIKYIFNKYVSKIKFLNKCFKKEVDCGV